MKPASGTSDSGKGYSWLPQTQRVISAEASSEDEGGVEDGEGLLCEGRRLRGEAGEGPWGVVVVGRAVVRFERRADMGIERGGLEESWSGGDA
jgi:hypothetical protein